MWPHVNTLCITQPHHYAVWHRFYECVKEKREEMTTKTQRLNHYASNKMKFKQFRKYSKHSGLI